MMSHGPSTNIEVLMANPESWFAKKDFFERVNIAKMNYLADEERYYLNFLAAIKTNKEEAARFLHQQIHESEKTQKLISNKPNQSETVNEDQDKQPSIFESILTGLVTSIVNRTHSHLAALEENQTQLLNDWNKAQHEYTDNLFQQLTNPIEIVPGLTSTFDDDDCEDTKEARASIEKRLLPSQIIEKLPEDHPRRVAIKILCDDEAAILMQKEGLSEIEAKKQAICIASDKMKLAERNTVLDDINLDRYLKRYAQHLMTKYPDVFAKLNLRTSDLKNSIRKHFVTPEQLKYRVKKIKEMDDGYQINKRLQEDLVSQRDDELRIVRDFVTSLKNNPRYYDQCNRVCELIDSAVKPDLNLQYRPSF